MQTGKGPNGFILLNNHSGYWLWNGLGSGNSREPGWEPGWRERSNGVTTHGLQNARSEWHLTIFKEHLLSTQSEVDLKIQL